jgi:hypothetical protein
MSFSRHRNDHWLRGVIVTQCPLLRIERRRRASACAVSSGFVSSRTAAGLWQPVVICWT